MSLNRVDRANVGAISVADRDVEAWSTNSPTFEIIPGTAIYVGIKHLNDNLRFWIAYSVEIV
jgi:hypothetical protein